MITASHKAKQYLLASAKVLVVAVSLGYIFYKLKNTATVNINTLTAAVFSKGGVSGAFFLLFITLAIANWYFEILKWQTLVSTFKKISFTTAFKQCLASFTVSVSTPNRIGEYGAKALFFESDKRKKILLLNFFSGGLQMLVTCFFGVFGLFYMFKNFNIPYTVSSFSYLIIGIIILLAIAYYFKEKELVIKGFTIAKTLDFFKNISFQIKLKTLLYSSIRYVIFSSMFYSILLFFGANIPIFDAFLLIFAMYLFVSVLPTFFILDVVIRGGVAVWVFSYTDISEITVLLTVLTMWLLNFALPAVIGSYFVLSYQPTSR